MAGGAVEPLKSGTFSHSRTLTYTCFMVKNVTFRAAYVSIATLTFTGVLVEDMLIVTRSRIAALTLTRVWVVPMSTTAVWFSRTFTLACVFIKLPNSWTSFHTRTLTCTCFMVKDLTFRAVCGSIAALTFTGVSVEDLCLLTGR